MIESRPPSFTWSRSSPPQPNQPPLDLTDHEPDVPEAAGPNHRGIRVSIVKARWAAKQRPGYPMPRGVEYPLALALIQALLGHRAVSQAILSKCALAKDQVATWTYSHGQAILVGCWRRCEGSRRPPGDVPRRRSSWQGPPAGRAESHIPGALTRRWNCRSGLSRSWLLDDWPSPMKSAS